jgi:hypothetical protein
VQPTSYVLPIRLSRKPAHELIDYLNRLSRLCDVVVVDGSPAPVFADFHQRCGPRVRHVAPDDDTALLMNGKVAGVLTGLRVARCERIIIADDDVRYDTPALAAVSAALDAADVVRPQNYFVPLPWHARLDTARSLINRVSGGDWPGTLAVRRSVLCRSNGYDGNVMFENLELVRTVIAAGGREVVRRDIFVRRLPPSARHYFSQRVRQAYDEFARPHRLLLWLSVLPALAVVARVNGAGVAAATYALPVLIAETGRRVAHGRRVFPASSSLLAPLWVLERGVAAWLAVALRITLGGVPYRGRVVRKAATPLRELRRRHGGASLKRSLSPFALW